MYQRRLALASLIVGAALFLLPRGAEAAMKVTGEVGVGATRALSGTIFANLHQLLKVSFKTTTANGSLEFCATSSPQLTITSCQVHLGTVGAAGIQTLTLVDESSLSGMVLYIANTGTVSANYTIVIE